ncbi:MAG: hypothetical protein NTY29_10825, partial [Proteobacteria bacterium]|nr:hypothetical protein [Pseudomonadota bacterium]
MSASDREIIQKVQQWIIYGDEDLQLAKHLKAYLIYYRIDFPYTHNIAQLLELCPDKQQWGTSL